MRLPAPRLTLFPYTTLFRSVHLWHCAAGSVGDNYATNTSTSAGRTTSRRHSPCFGTLAEGRPCGSQRHGTRTLEDRKSTRLNSSHVSISYAVFCLKKKTRIR